MKVMLALAILMIAGSAGTEISGYKVQDEMHRWFFAGGMLILVLMLITNLVNKWVAVRMKALDVKHRGARLEAGLDVEKDETVIGKEKPQ